MTLPLRQMLFESSLNNNMKRFSDYDHYDMVVTITNLEKRLEKLDSKKAKKLPKLKNKLDSERAYKFKNSDDVYSMIDLSNLDIFKGLKLIGRGYTSAVFKHPKDKTKVLGITTDNKKIKWFTYNKDLFKFKLLDTIPLTQGNDGYIYEIIKVTKNMENGDIKYKQSIYSDIVVPFIKIRNLKAYGNTTIKDIENIKKTVKEKELVDILTDIEKCFRFDKNTTIDLHGGQWGEVNNRIILFDPVLSIESTDQLDNKNKLDFLTKIRNLKIFN